MIENPAFFCQEINDLDELGLEIIQYSENYGFDYKHAKAFLYKILYQAHSVYKKSL